MDSNFFNWLQYYLDAVFQLMQDTIIFRAYGFNVSLWDLYTISTTLILFFDCVIFPIMQYWGLADASSDGLADEVNPDDSDD